MLGYRFSKYSPPPEKDKSDFEKLLKVFMQLLLITSGNVAEALQWLTEVDRQYGLTNANYGIGDFIVDLKRDGYITEEGPKGEFKLNAKSEQRLRQSAGPKTPPRNCEIPHDHASRKPRNRHACYQCPRSGHFARHSIGHPRARRTRKVTPHSLRHPSEGWNPSKLAVLWNVRGP